MHRETSDLGLFRYKPRPAGSVCTKNTLVRYSSVQTSRSVNMKLLLRDYIDYLIVFFPMALDDMKNLIENNINDNE
jgi:hypothetical protein